MDFNETIKAWQLAATDLGISVKAPMILRTKENENIRFEILIENFGSVKGTLITSIDDLKNINIPSNYGFYCSALNLKSYSIYNRLHFIDTLNDWSYFGEKTLTPSWYNGVNFY